MQSGARIKSMVSDAKNIHIRIVAYVLAVSFLALGYYAYQHSHGTTPAQVAVTQKCPDDYATDKEQATAMDSWTSEFYATHPRATLSDWSEARHQFWIDNNCTLVLQRYQDAKDDEVDPETLEQIKNGLQKQ